MSILWSRESQSGFSIHVDLFGNVSNDLLSQFTDWDSKLLNSDWKRIFLEEKLPASKSNSMARKFGEIGNEFYRRKEWRQAIEFYNQGICFAEPDSVQLSVQLGKRAYCFRQLNMYKEGIEDAEIALSGNFPPNWISVLRKCQNEWKQEASKDANQSDQNSRNIPKLSFDADDAFPCIANVLDVTEDNEFRTHFVAKTDIDIGQVVLVEENFVSISNGFDRAYCLTCMRTHKNFIPCSNCTDVMFCNTECMNRNEVHKITCGKVYNRMPTDVKFVLQSILEAIVLFSTVQSLMQFVEHLLQSQSESMCLSSDSGNFEYGLFLSMLSTLPTNELPLLLIYQVYKTLMSMPQIQSRFDRATKQRFLMHLVSHHALVLKNCAFGGFETNQHQFLVATMSPFVSLCEHSCTPNVVRFSINNHEVFITIRYIKVGDRITFDYWADATETENRRAWMQEQGINCECGKCEQLYMTNHQMSNDPSFFYISNYKEHFDRTTSPALKEKCINFLQKFKDEEWSREMDIVVKLYIQCLIADLK